MNPQAWREIKPFLTLLGIVAFLLILGGCRRTAPVSSQPATPPPAAMPTPETTTPPSQSDESSTRTPKTTATPILRTARILPRREPRIDVVRSSLNGKGAPQGAIVENDKTPQREVVSPVRRLCEPDFLVHWNNHLRAVFLRDKAGKWTEIEGQLVLIEKWTTENGKERLVDQEAFTSPMAISDATGWGAQVKWNKFTAKPEIEYSK